MDWRSVLATSFAVERRKGQNGGCAKCTDVRFRSGNCTMRRLFWLPRLVIAVWLSWLALLGLLAGMLIGGAAWHPHFLPVTAVLGALIAAGTVLVGRAAWQIARGPRRHEAVSCLLLGVAPYRLVTGGIFRSTCRSSCSSRSPSR